MNLRTLMTKTPETPMRKVRMEDRRKHHHFRSFRHSSTAASSSSWKCFNNSHLVYNKFTLHLLFLNPSVGNC